ncbi:hypothetical protein C8R43DRAFT_617047 [Mycena crocata]|nr:hypothetical protein C8R43DRAFT_617047 [Mycena crocata]
MNTQQALSPPSTPKNRLRRRAATVSNVTPPSTSSARFSRLLTSVLGSPFLTTAEMATLPPHLDLVDGADAAVPRADTVTRPPSPDPADWALYGFDVVTRDERDQAHDDADWPFKRASPFRSILPRLWDVLSASPPRRSLPSNYSSSSSGSNSAVWGLAGTGGQKQTWKQMQIDYAQLPPLDGEEGELVDDEACFFCPPVRAVTGIDILALLPRNSHYTSSPSSCPPPRPTPNTTPPPPQPSSPPSPTMQSQPLQPWPRFSPAVQSPAAGAPSRAIMPSGARHLWHGGAHPRRGRVRLAIRLPFSHALRQYTCRRPGPPSAAVRAPRSCSTRSSLRCRRVSRLLRLLPSLLHPSLSRRGHQHHPPLRLAHRPRHLRCNPRNQLARRPLHSTGAPCTPHGSSWSGDGRGGRMLLLFLRFPRLLPTHQRHWRTHSLPCRSRRPQTGYPRRRRCWIPSRHRRIRCRRRWRGARGLRLRRQWRRRGGSRLRRRWRGMLIASTASSFRARTS